MARGWWRVATHLDVDEHGGGLDALIAHDDLLRVRGRVGGRGRGRARARVRVRVTVRVGSLRITIAHVVR